ncbi:unnamed protein product [Clonostachys rosea f. rosea IK726]|uniref:Uncharacterized protein n=2 Tax=Bionectria ochroleuca TaxID=29856 RepID=A0A0B7KQA2_BIOOC|nr:unnamed protein product [Clonostachys rosea f. rosea IK726]
MTGPPKHDSEPHSEVVQDYVFNDLPCYRFWVLQQIHSLPDQLFLSLPNLNCHTDITSSVWSTQFIPLWNRARGLVQGSGPRTIDSITEAILQANHILVNENYEAYQSAKELVFNIKNYCSFDTEDRKLFNTTKLVNVKEINAHVLDKVLWREDQNWIGRPGLCFFFGMLHSALRASRARTKVETQYESPLSNAAGRLVRLNSYATAKKPRAVRQL